MPSKPPADSTAAARRGRPRDPERAQRVLDAARQHFYTHGFERASVDAIAQQAGVSKMTVYSYYPSKEALFEAVIGARTEGVVGGLAGAHAFDARQPEAVLTQIGTQFLKLMRDHGTLGQFRTMFAASATQPEACRAFYKQGPERLISDLAEYLRATHKAGMLKVPQPRVAADLFLAMFLGDNHLHAMLGLGLPSAKADKQLLHEAVRAFMSAYATSTRS
jgi:AcrR family transcriptional regulator